MRFICREMAELSGNSSIPWEKVMQRSNPDLAHTSLVYILVIVSSHTPVTPRDNSLFE